MGQISVEITAQNGSVLSGNQQIKHLRPMRKALDQSTTMRWRATKLCATASSINKTTPPKIQRG